MDKEREQAIIMDEEREQAVIIIKIKGWGETMPYHNGWRERGICIIMNEEGGQAIL